MVNLVIHPKDTAIQLFLIISLFVISNNLLAQKFGFSASAGVNASQIDGDGVQGYHRLGTEISLSSFITLKSKTEIQIGLAFSERGALERFARYTPTDELAIGLRYVCIPLQLHFKDWQSEDTYFKIHYFAGVSYGRLFDTNIRPGSQNVATENYNVNDVSWTAGFQYFVHKNWGLGFQYTGSLNLLYDSRKFEQSDFPSLRSYFLTLRLIYRTN